MFGRHLQLPVDMAFGVDYSPGAKTHISYVCELKERLHEAYKRASQAALKAQGRQKSLYDRRIRAATLESGDRVLVRVLAL